MTQQQIKYYELKRIAEKPAVRQVDGFYVDPYSASLMVNVADRLSKRNRERFLSTPIDRMADIAHVLCNKELSKSA